ncbi:MAG: AAA family ATPase [Myxococcota bacterium]
MSSAVELRVLGPIAVFRNGEPIRLPQSKKTRGLLGYLAITGRAHRRDRLCSLLWDVADDPRGALRWSLSKIRPLVDSDDKRTLLADREHVELQLETESLDWHLARQELSGGVESLTTERLEALVEGFQGELLEGLDLMDFDEFTAWCAAEREHARSSHAMILRALVERYVDEPDKALPHAREVVRIDPLNQEARAGLIRMLAAAGRRNEAQAQYESASRLLEELGARRAGPLVAAWHDIRTVGEAEPQRAPSREEALPEDVRTEVGTEPTRQGLLVGRGEERSRLNAVLDRTVSEGRLQVFLLKGESGVGKTTLLSELSREAQSRGCATFEGAAYEAEAGRPYGPWIDALRRLPENAFASEHRSTLARILPELGTPDEQQGSRDRLFAAIVDTVLRGTTKKTPTLLLFDDVHWCDDASTELLHYVARMSRERPVAMVLGARDGELVDNESSMRMLRSFRREGLIDEHLLLPLTEGDVADLVEQLGSGADAAQVFAQSGGNALLAHELAQAREAAGGVPRSLKELILDRINRLSPETGDLLRWAAILGPSIDVARLTELVSVDFDGLMNALASLERHSLLDHESGGDGNYEFHHGLVHSVVYSEISEPRRKLMHLRVAKLLEGRTDPDGEIAMEIAHHAGVGGDHALAAGACVVAGNRCLRMFANAEAYAHARRGIRYADALPHGEGLRRKIELEEVSAAARTPDNIEEESRRLEALAEEALDAGEAQHARRGFTIVSYLRWQAGATGDAARLSLRAEFASRGADDSDRIVGMAEAARCLVTLERDVPQAEALLLEARALTERSGESAWAVSDGLGLLRFYGGELDEARAAFEHAWAAAKESGDRINEFMTLEQLVLVAHHQGDASAACGYAETLAAIGDKLREGSERPLGRAMVALCAFRAGDEAQRSALEEAINQLRQVDAKQRLSSMLIETALVEYERGEYASAKARAEEALALAEVLRHPSNGARARTVLLRVARTTGDEASAAEQARCLAVVEPVAHHVRGTVDRLLEDEQSVDAEKETRS